MNDLQKQFLKQKAKSMYSSNNNTLTKKQIVVRCHERSADFILEAKEAIENGKRILYVDNTNKALTILRELAYNLNYEDELGNRNEIAYDLYSIYQFTVQTLTNGMKELSKEEINFKVCSESFDICAKQLMELADAYNSAKDI